MKNKNLLPTYVYMYIHVHVMLIANTCTGLFSHRVAYSLPGTVEVHVGRGGAFGLFLDIHVQVVTLYTCTYVFYIHIKLACKYTCT